jgi:glc operon protein GlcG
MIVRKLALMTSAVAFAASFAQAQAPQIPQYGPNITLDQARSVAAAADADAKTRGWPMVIAIVDTAGMLVYYQKSDGAQNASVRVSQQKAETAALYRRPTKVLQDAIAGGGAGLRFLSLPGASVVEGGIPLMIGGKIVGAIGISGMASDQDGVIAVSGAAALK